MRRILAVVGAVAMVAGALYVRGRLDDREEERSEVYRLVCSIDLGPVCDDLQSAYPGRVELTVESAGTTADRLRRLEGDPEVDGWVVADPWPAIVDGARQSATLPPVFDSDADAEPLARSPLLVVAWKERSEALGGSPGCPEGTVGWKCLGDAAGDPWTDWNGQENWGAVKVGHADATDDGTGLLVLGQATVEWFGRTDLSTFDLEDEGFQRWFSGLERSMGRATGSPLRVMLSIGRAAFDAVGTTEADAAIVDRAASREALVRLYPAAMATADVVLAVPSGNRGERLRDLVADRIGDSLTDSGWKKPGAPGLPAGNGLPEAGLLDALRSKAREATGR